MDLNIEFWRDVLMAWRHCNALIRCIRLQGSEWCHGLQLATLSSVVDDCQELIEKLDDDDFNELVAHGVDCADWR